LIVSIVSFIFEWSREYYYNQMGKAKEELTLEHTHLKKVVEELHYLSTTDSLTGCYNRNYFSRHLQGEIARIRRYGGELSVIMCDLDNFKTINDSFGHAFGDEVLKRTGKIFLKMTRTDIDWVVRFGGEEFLIVLPSTCVPGAKILAERIREEIEKEPVRYQDRKIHYSASFGVAPLDQKTAAEKTLEDLIHEADMCLLEAKSSGKNRVIAKI